MFIRANRLSCSSSVVLRTWHLQLKSKTNCWRWATAEKKLKRKVVRQLPWVTQSLIPAAKELLCNMMTFPPLREWAFVWLFALFYLGIIDRYHWIAHRGLMLDLARQGPFALTLTLICKCSGSLQLSAPKQSLASSVWQQQQTMNSTQSSVNNTTVGLAIWLSRVAPPARTNSG